MRDHKKVTDKMTKKWKSMCIIETGNRTIFAERNNYE